MRYCEYAKAHKQEERGREHYRRSDRNANDWPDSEGKEPGRSIVGEARGIKRRQGQGREVIAQEKKGDSQESRPN